MSWMRSVFFCSALVMAVVAYLLHRHTVVDERLQLPMTHTHFMLPISRIIKKMRGASVNVDGPTFRNSLKPHFMLRSFCLGKDPPQELESVFKQGGVEVMRFKRVKRVQNPTTTLVYIHGGGYVIGSPEMVAGPIHRLEHGTDSQLFFIRYRLAPEHLFPTAVDDCVAMVKYIMDHSDQLGVDKHNVQIFGDSAGGMLATLVAIELLKNQEQYPLKAVHAIYPWYYILNDMPSAKKFSIDPSDVLDQTDLARFMSFYLLGDTSCMQSKVTNEHLTQKVWEKYLLKTKEFKLKNFPQPVTSHFKSSKDKSSDCAARLESMLLDPRNNIIFHEKDQLQRLNKTDFRLYSCEVDILRDDSYLMASMLDALEVKYNHVNIESCYHGSVHSTNAVGGEQLRQELIRSMRR